MVVCCDASDALNSSFFSYDPPQPAAAGITAARRLYACDRIRHEIDLEAAQAFTVSDDREAQERVFSELSEWNRRPDTIRSALTADDTPTSDKRVRLISYQGVGGIIRQDLFRKMVRII